MLSHVSDLENPPCYNVPSNRVRTWGKFFGVSKNINCTCTLCQKTDWKIIYNYWKSFRVHYKLEKLFFYMKKKLCKRMDLTETLVNKNFTHHNDIKQLKKID